MRLLASIQRANHTIEGLSARAVRFISDNGSTRAERMFWRAGAIIAALEATIAFFSEVIGILGLINHAFRVGIVTPFAIIGRIVAVYLLYRFIIAAAQIMREPLFPRGPKQ